MKKLLHFLIFIVITSCSDPQLTTSDKLVEKDNISYFGNSKTPYTGEVIDYHINQNIKMTGKFLDGKKEGQWNTFFLYLTEDGEPAKQYEEFYTNGEKNGKFISFEDDGKTVQSTTEWKDGSFVEYLEYGVIKGDGRSGSLKERIYHKNDKIFAISYPDWSEYYNEYVFVDKNYKGDIRCKVTDKKTNQAVDHYDSFTDGTEYFDDGISFQTWKDCELNGETETYRDGLISEKGFYKENKKTGKWITFDSSTGSPSEIKNYKDDEYHGLVQKFDDSILFNQKNFENGFLIEEKRFNKDGRITYEETNTRDNKSITVEYKTLFETPVGYISRHHLYDFYTVMGNASGYWDYIDRSCDSEVRKKTNYNFFDCLSDTRNLREPNIDPIKITTSLSGSVKDGFLEISDPEDGHVYTRINYSRDGKLGEYKIYNKEGLIIYSVNCLKGGSRYRSMFYYANGRETYSGNCRKDGEEIKYRRSPFTKEKKWYLYSRKIFENDKIVSSKFYGDPFRKEEQIYEGKIIIPYDEYIFVDMGRGVKGMNYVVPKKTK